MIEVIPAIDIIGGRCVRLSQGDYDRKKEYGAPSDMARLFADAGAGRIHLVDLDGAKASSPANLKVLEEVASLGCMKIEWGGGIKTAAALHDVLDAGADYAIVGSVAALRPELFEEWLCTLGADRIILGADVRGTRVAVNGWKEDSPLELRDMLDRFAAAGLRQVVCTDISRDGMLCGPAAEMYKELQAAYPDVDFTVSGGISSNDDIVSLNAAGLRKVIVGKAFYEGRITMKELESWWQNA